MTSDPPTPSPDEPSPPAATPPETVQDAAEAALTEIAATLDSIRAAASDVQKKAAKVDAIGKSVEGTKATIEQTREAVAEFQRASQADSEATIKLKTDAAEAASAAAASRAAADSVLAQINALRTQAEEHERQASANQTQTAGLAKRAVDIEANLKEYETALATLKQDHASWITQARKEHGELVETIESGTQSLHKKIENLMPGATGAGLAAAFGDRKNAIANSARLWLGIFGGALLLLFIAAGALLGLVPVPQGLSSVAIPATTDLRELGEHLLRRVALLIAPLWLALFANRRLNAFTRLEEDYAHKVAMSMSFEGYKRELKGITEQDGAVAKHTEALIDALRQSPVRLFDARHSSDTPFEAAIDTVTRGVEKGSGLLAKLAKVIKP